jgi:hypothetical protein
VFDSVDAPGTTRTCDLLVRSLTRDWSRCSLSLARLNRDVIYEVPTELLISLSGWFDMAWKTAVGSNASWWRKPGGGGDFGA